MTGRFSRLPAAAVLDHRLSAENLRVLAVLGCYADKFGHCYPAVTTIARVLDIDRRGVQRHLRKLENTGYVETEPTLRATRGGWGRNRYWLRYPPMPANDSLMANDGDAAPDTASDPVTCNVTPENDDTMRHQVATDAAPDVASDAAPGTAQTIPLIYPTENEPSGHAHVRSRRDGIIVYDDGRWEPDLEAPSPLPAPLAQQDKNLAQAPPLKRKTSKRPKDHVTEMAKDLAVIPGFDLTLAWEAIMALPGEVLVRLEGGDLPMPELVSVLKALDSCDTPAWRRIQDGLAQVEVAK